MLRVLYSHSRLHSLFLVLVFYHFIYKRTCDVLFYYYWGKKKSINISDCFVRVAYKNLSFNNGFNIFYSITLLTVFIYNIYCFASVKMNRDISLKLCFVIYISYICIKYTRYVCVSTLLAHWAALVNCKYKEIPNHMLVFSNLRP